jgi:hypothetical protein
MKTTWAVAAIVLLLVCANSCGEEPATHYYNHGYSQRDVSARLRGVGGGFAAQRCLLQ